MKILSLFKTQKRNKTTRALNPGKVVDFYQDSIEKIGRDQFKKLVEKGLSIPVLAL